MKTTGKKVFIPADAFIRAHGINAKRPPNTLLANCVDIVYSKIAYEAQVEKDYARAVIETVIGRIGEIIGQGQETLRGAFGPLGTLYGENRSMMFRFQTGGNGSKSTSKFERDENATASFSRDAPASAMGLSLGGSAMSMESERAPAQQSERSSVFQSSRAASSQRTAAANDTAKQSTPWHRGTARGRKPGTQVPTSTLNGSHMAMVSEKEASAAAQREADQEDFRASMSTMQSEQQSLNQKGLQRRAENNSIAADQKAQHAASMAATRQERDEDNARGPEPWPFRTTEDVQHHKSQINRDFKDGLDSQVQAASSSKSMTKSLSTTQSRSQMASTHNIFPKFLNPERTVARGHFVPAAVFDKTMQRSWNGVADGYEDEKAELAREERAVRLRRERAELAHQKKAIEQRREAAQLNEFLKEQAHYKQKLEHDYEHERFYGKDPDPSQAYPVEKKRNVLSESMHKTKLKDALDSQVREKENKMKELKRQESQEDSFFVECVQQALEDDRDFRRTKMQNDKQMLTGEWGRQSMMKDRRAALDHRREHLTMFTDLSVSGRSGTGA
jgi:hypothetical protein